jgi:putative FmdB family regulatory protein
MPIYEYECKECKLLQEFIVKNDQVKVECKKCNSTDLKKLISTGTNFKLMGRGWHGSN